MRRSITAAALLLACAAHAAPFVDPTLPPSLNDPGSGSAASSGPQVESILIAPDRRIAVINGEQVTLGSKVAGGAVVRISETEVVVRSAQGEQTFRLFPEIRRPSGAPTKGGKSP